MKIRTAATVFILVLSFLFSGCTEDALKAGAFLAKDQQYYDNLKISREPSPWEDGLRTSGKENSYEWWYFDSEYTDGTKVVAVFFTKHKLDVKGPAHPTIQLDISLPDGRKIAKEVSEETGTLIRAAKDKCDVQIKDSYIRYRDGKYELHVTVDDIKFDCVMTPRLPMWRPGTGHTYFGDTKEKYFAWFVAVPAGEISAKLAIGDNARSLQGRGYHDHNWGNEEMNKIWNHWYWARVAFDDYSFIGSDTISEKKYGYARVPSFLLAKGGKIINDNEATVKIIRADTVQHPITKKFMDNTLSFIQKTGDGTTYRIDLIKKEDLLNWDLLEMSGLSPFMIRLARLMGENPTYTRMAGDAILTITDKDNNEKILKTTAIWEQMSFGKNRDAIVHDYR